MSDLWGKEKSDWTKQYIDHLSNHFDVTYYDCCELGAIDTSNYSEEALHKQFVDGGIDIAVQRLLELELDNVNVLAFSVGGVIAWKLGLISNVIDSLYCVSSTRLRHETLKPDCTINLYFGDNDKYAPNKQWFSKMNIDSSIINKSNHLVYILPNFAKNICEEICKY